MKKLSSFIGGILIGIVLTIALHTPYQMVVAEVNSYMEYRQKVEEEARQKTFFEVLQEKFSFND